MKKYKKGMHRSQSAGKALYRVVSVQLRKCTTEGIYGMKTKILLVLLLLNGCLYAQYYDKKIELPITLEYNEMILSVINPIKTSKGYLLPYSVDYNIPRREQMV